MKQLLAAALCLTLAGCSGFVFPGPDDGVRMQAASPDYTPGPEGDYVPPIDDERMTSTCTMKGQGAVCR